MQELRQSTAVDVRIGPFVDVGDAVTPETGITLGAADQAEALKHNGAATVDISGRTWAAVTGSDGWYDLTLTTDDTDTLGLLEIIVQDASVCLAVYARFMVVTANYWDSKCSTDYRHVDVIQIEGGDATDAIGDAVLDEALGSHTGALAILMQIAEGDTTIDTSTTPWQLVIKKKSTATELVRKDLKEVDGTDITGTDQIVGQQTEP